MTVCPFRGHLEVKWFDLLEVKLFDVLEVKEFCPIRCQVV